jgi:hypothetical protein
MRRHFLFQSVSRLLRPDEVIIEVVVMWQRHRLMLPFSVFAAIAVFVGATIVGFQTGPAVGLAVAAVGMAAASTTEHRVLAQTSHGLRLLRGSRIRQVAVELIGDLPDDTPIEMTGHRFVLSEWRVGDHGYTVPKSSEGAMTRIAASR